MIRKILFYGVAASLLSFNAGCAILGGCHDPCGGGCGPVANDCCCPGRGPLDLIVGLLNHNCYQGRVCGERYWGEWHSDPVDGCDPCDCYGNYTGRGCGYGNVAPGPHAVPGEIVEGEIVYEGHARPAAPRMAPTRTAATRMPVQTAPAPRPIRAAPKAASTEPYYVGSPRIISETDEVVGPDRLAKVTTEEPVRTAQPTWTPQRHAAVPSRIAPR
jgi:hypothetical protein